MGASILIGEGQKSTSCDQTVLEQTSEARPEHKVVIMVGTHEKLLTDCRDSEYQTVWVSLRAQPISYHFPF